MCLEGKCEVSLSVYVFTWRPIFPFTEMSLFACNRGAVIFVFRTQEELRVREEDQQTITVEVELKRHDSEPNISVPPPAEETK